MKASILTGAALFLATASAAFAAGGPAPISCEDLGHSPVPVSREDPGQTPAQAPYVLSIGNRAQAIGFRVLNRGQENDVLAAHYLIGASPKLHELAQFIDATIDLTGRPGYVPQQQRACALKRQAAESLRNGHRYLLIPGPSGQISEEDFKTLRCEVEVIGTAIGCGALYIAN